MAPNTCQETLASSSIRVEGAHGLLPAALLAAAEQDLRAMLTTIKNGAEAIARLDRQRQASNVASIVVDAVHQLASALEELVATAGQVVSGELDGQVVDLRAILDAGLAARGAGPCLLERGRPIYVAGNEVLLRHLLGNLTNTAVEASGVTGVKVLVRCRQNRTARVEIIHPAPSEAQVSEPSTDRLHLDNGRSKSIAAILATVAAVDYRVDVSEGTYRVMLDVPNVIDHPSATKPSDEAVSGPHLTNDVAGLTAPPS